mgnify:FL=1
MIQESVSGSVRRSRHPVRATVQLVCAGQRWRAEVLDLSLTGFRVMRPWDFPDAPPGWTTSIVLIPGSGEGILATAELTRCDLAELGFRFVEPSAEDELRIAALIRQQMAGMQRQ